MIFPETKYKQIQTELCVTLRPLDSFESGGFERVSVLADRFSVRPSAAASLSRSSEEVGAEKCEHCSLERR